MLAKKSIIPLVFLLLAACFVASAAEKLSSTFERKVVSYQLPNGMKWLLLPRPNSPVFAGIVYVKAGGSDEEPGKTGLAHLLEHMAFKGTKDISTDELWNAFATNGAGDVNAYTSKDATAYYAKMPSGKLELWLYLNSEMIFRSVVRDFEKERDVVTEELMTSIENSPGGKMYQTLLDTAFESGPYKWPTIGSKKDVVNMQPEFLAEFRKKYYVPNRMVGAIVGDIDIENAKHLIDKYFGQMPRGRNFAETAGRNGVQNAKREAAVKFNASPRLKIAYHKPTLPSRDDYVFDVLTYVLCDGENSRFQKNLVYKEKLVRSIGCDSSTPGARFDNLFVVSAEPMKGHSYEDVLGAIESEINRLKNEPVSESELSKAKNNIEREFVFGLDSNEGIAHSLAYYETIAGDWRYVARHSDMIKKIGASDLQEIAKKYFTDGNKTVVRLEK